MLKGSFWIPVAAFLVLTPFLLLLGLASAGAGHGNYLMAKILFPLTMLSTIALDRIADPFLWLAVMQYPIYGVILGIASLKGRLSRALRIILAIHGIAAFASLIAVSKNFS